MNQNIYNQPLAATPEETKYVGHWCLPLAELRRFYLDGCQMPKTYLVAEAECVEGLDSQPMDWLTLVPAVMISGGSPNDRRRLASDAVLFLGLGKSTLVKQEPYAWSEQGRTCWLKSAIATASNPKLRTKYIVRDVYAEFNHLGLWTGTVLDIVAASACNGQALPEKVRLEDVFLLSLQVESKQHFFAH